MESLDLNIFLFPKQRKHANLRGMNIQEVKRVEAIFSEGYNEVQSLVEKLFSKDKNLKYGVSKVLRLAKEQGREDVIGKFLVIQYIMGKALTSPAIMRALLKANEEVLSPDAKQALSYWIEHPAFWSCFSFVRNVEGFLCEAKDILTDESLLIYSKGLLDTQKKPEMFGKNYIVLLTPNGQCLQTVGLFHYFPGTVEDLTYYGNLLDKALFSKGGLSALIEAHFSEFFALDSTSNQMQIVQNQEIFQICYAHVEPSAELFAQLDGSTWEKEQLGKTLSYSLHYANRELVSLSSDLQLMQGILAKGMKVFTDTEHSFLLLRANTYTSFQLLARYLQLPSLEAEHVLSLFFVLFLENQGTDLPWSPFPLVSEEESERKDGFQYLSTIMKEYLQCQDTGSPFVLEDRCKAHGVDVEVFKAFVGDFLQSQKKHALHIKGEDEQYAIDRWSAPDVDEIEEYALALTDSALFYFDETDEVLAMFGSLTGNTMEEDLYEAGLPSLVEELFFEEFGFRVGVLVMNTLFVIMHARGKEALYARSYALEILKLFPSILAQYDDDSEAFIVQFSKFVLRKLCTKGICSIQSRPGSDIRKKGLFPIMATPFQLAFINPFRKQVR